jgi:methyltransferase (TIGR00027 family)
MKAIDTGFQVSLLRAIGMLYPKEKRIYDDPFSKKTLTGMNKFWYMLMRNPKILNLFMNYAEKSTPGVTASQFCRYRYIDDVLKDCIAKKEIKTVVNLGAGMDPRAYFIPGVENMQYFEVDHPSVIKKKKTNIKKALGKLPKQVIYVPVDFEKQSLDAELNKAGYDLTSKTLFIWEGVTQYLTEEANDSTMKYLAKAASGSKIVFSYVLKDFINGVNIHDGIKNIYKMMVTKNKIFIYGLDPEEIGNYLSKYSLSLIEDVGPEVYKERYKALEKLGLDIFEEERIVLAEVK